jgi:predicted GNAT family N-acyltransferase
MEINTVTWEEAQSALRLIRQKVFVEEQQVPEDLEWDSVDKIATHLLGKEGNRPVACARITHEGKLGRLAVLKEYRKHGWGSRQLRAAEQYLLEQKKPKLYLNSQANSYYFYFQCGYRPEPEMFWDANIPHIRMQKILNRPSSLSNTYLLGLDEESHYSDQPAASAVWFQIGSSQSRRAIDIIINDLAHPVFNNTFCVENLSQFVRQSRQTQVRVLINKEIPGLSEHPLLLTQQRLSSRFLIQRIEDSTNKELNSNQVLFDLAGHLRFDYQSSYCNFNNKISVSRHKVHFEQEWAKSKNLIEGRKLSI